MVARTADIRFVYFSFILMVIACGQAVSSVTDTNTLMQQDRNTNDTVLKKDTTNFLQVLSPYDSLQLIKTEELHAAPGTKSVLFNSTGSKLYAMNLEGMSIYEFDQASRKVERIFKFKPSKGIGWNYAKNRPIPSFKEKPVEGCLTHNNSILWVSLHNADGIVPIFLNPTINHRIPDGIMDSTIKKVYVTNVVTGTKDSMVVPLIITGKTPKIISATADNSFLLVSNWHSHSISILQMDTSKSPFATIIKDIPVTTIPRGIAVDNKAQKSYVAQMGGAEITVINHSNWEASTPVQVSKNPRHIVLDTMGRLYVSFNALNTVSCVDVATGQSLFTTKTGSQPRTIILSKNQKFLFVTCYASDMVEVFKIYDNRFEKIADLPCKGSPVGVDIFENDTTLEAWVCKYVTGNISIYTFKKQ